MPDLDDNDDLALSALYEKISEDSKWSIDTTSIAQITSLLYSPAINPSAPRVEHLKSQPRAKAPRSVSLAISKFQSTSDELIQAVSNSRTAEGDLRLADTHQDASNTLILITRNSFKEQDKLRRENAHLRARIAAWDGYRETLRPKLESLYKQIKADNAQAAGLLSYVRGLKNQLLVVKEECETAHKQVEMLREEIRLEAEDGNGLWRIRRQILAKEREHISSSAGGLVEEIPTPRELQLQDEIRCLQAEAKRKAPLVEVGILVRLRHMENRRCRILGLEYPHIKREIIRDGGEAADEDNGPADYAAFKTSGFRWFREKDWEIFKHMYGMEVSRYDETSTNRKDCDRLGEERRLLKELDLSEDVWSRLRVTIGLHADLAMWDKYGSDIDCSSWLAESGLIYHRCKLILEEIYEILSLRKQPESQSSEKGVKSKVNYFPEECRIVEMQPATKWSVKYEYDEEASAIDWGYKEEEVGCVNLLEPLPPSKNCETIVFDYKACTFEVRQRGEEPHLEKVIEIECANGKIHYDMKDTSFDEEKLFTSLQTMFEMWPKHAHKYSSALQERMSSVKSFVKRHYGPVGRWRFEWQRFRRLLPHTRELDPDDDTAASLTSHESTSTHEPSPDVVIKEDTDTFARALEFDPHARQKRKYDDSTEAFERVLNDGHRRSQKKSQKRSQNMP